MAKHSRLVLRIKEHTQMEINSTESCIRLGIKAAVVIALIFGAPDIIAAMRWW